MLAAEMDRFRSDDPGFYVSLRRTAEHFRKSPPQASWQLMALSQISPGNRLFTKENTKAHNDESSSYSGIQVSNPDGFFDNLNLPAGKSKRRRYFGFLDKQQKERAILERME